MFKHLQAVVDDIRVVNKAQLFKIVFAPFFSKVDTTQTQWLLNNLFHFFLNLLKEGGVKFCPWEASIGLSSEYDTIVLCNPRDFMVSCTSQWPFLLHYSRVSSESCPWTLQLHLLQLQADACVETLAWCCKVDLVWIWAKVNAVKCIGDWMVWKIFPLVT